MLLFDNLFPKFLILTIYFMNLLNCRNVSILVKYMLNKVFEIRRFVLSFAKDLEFFDCKIGFSIFIWCVRVFFITNLTEN